MNKFFNTLLLLALFLGAAGALNAQELGTDDDGFIVQIISPANIAQTLFHGADPGVHRHPGSRSRRCRLHHTRHPERRTHHAGSRRRAAGSEHRRGGYRTRVM